MLPSSPHLNTSDVKLIEDEEFDFDLPISPPDSRIHLEAQTPAATEEAGSDSEDDIVFFGPQGHNERCIAAAVQEEANDIVAPLTPLSNEQHVELFKEAQTLVYHLAQQRKSSSDSNSSPIKPPTRQLTKPLVNLIDQGQTKRKLSDTSFISAYSESDVSDNLSHLSIQDHSTLSHCTSSPGSDAGGGIYKNRTFTLTSPEPVPADLSRVLPKPKLTPDPHGVVKFGAVSNSGCSGSGKGKSSLLKPPRSNLPRISPPKKQRVLPTSSDNNDGFKHPTLNARRSLGKPANTAARKSIAGGVPRRSGLKPPGSTTTNNTSSSLNATLPVLSTRQSNLGSKLPGAGRGSGLKAPGVTMNRSMNSSVLSSDAKTQFTGLRMPGTMNKAPALGSSNTGIVKPTSGIKVPSAKPQLMRPGALSQQRKTLAATRMKPVKTAETPGMKPPGPVKAFMPVPKVLTKTEQVNDTFGMKPPGPVKAFMPVPMVLTKTEQVNNTFSKPIKPAENIVRATPTKQHKKVQPKKIFAVPEPAPMSRCPPTPERKNSDSSFSTGANNTPSQSAKRKSFLPTPKRCSVGSGFRSSGSSVSSMDSILAGSPMVGKTKQPRVQHTPLGGNKENEPKRSIWSPIAKVKHITKEDEVISCTKRSALSTQN